MIFRSLLALALIVMGFALRWPQLSRWELHVDEALYADVSRHVIERGDILINGAKSDKPPLLYWLQAPCMLLSGFSEMAARLPGLIAWLLAAWLIWSLLPSVWGEDASLLALALWCLSPYGILFTATGFTDSLMLSFGMIGLVFAAAGRPWAAGICLGLSLASKQTGLLYVLPALFMLKSKADLKTFAKAFSLVLVPLLLWSVLIANPKFGIWSRAMEYASAAAEGSAKVRFAEVLSYAMQTGAGLTANGMAAILILLALLWPSPSKAGRASAVAVLAYAALLVFSHGRIYDRYWLWALAPLCMAVAAGAASLPEFLPGPLAMLFAILLFNGWQSEGRTWAYGAENQGFAEAKSWSTSKLEAGETLYLAGKAKALGWKALFYFHPAKGQNLKQQEIQSFKEAKGPGWVLAFKGDFKGRKADFDSGKGLLLWRVGQKHGS
jgi:4-amino-4-deoxy-L-arabinose transferase-like glycosyltransferase